MNKLNIKLELCSYDNTKLGLVYRHSYYRLSWEDENGNKYAQTVSPGPKESVDPREDDTFYMGTYVNTAMTNVKYYDKNDIETLESQSTYYVFAEEIEHVDETYIREQIIDNIKFEDIGLANCQSTFISSGDKAEIMYNKIAFLGKLFEGCEIDYDAIGPNCNTATIFMLNMVDPTSNPLNLLNQLPIYRDKNGAPRDYSLNDDLLHNGFLGINDFSDYSNIGNDGKIEAVIKLYHELEKVDKSIVSDLGASTNPNNVIEFDYLTGSISLRFIRDDGSAVVVGSDMFSEVLTGTDGNDVIYNSGSNGISDELNGGSGDDLLISGKGRDKLNGGADNDTYIINAGYGVDIINDISGFDDKLKLDVKGNYSYYQDGTSLIITNSEAGTNEITIENYFKNSASTEIGSGYIENINIGKNHINTFDYSNDGSLFSLVTIGKKLDPVVTETTASVSEIDVSAPLVGGSEELVTNSYYALGTNTKALSGSDADEWFDVEMDESSNLITQAVSDTIKNKYFDGLMEEYNIKYSAYQIKYKKWEDAGSVGTPPSAPQQPSMSDLPNEFKYYGTSGHDKFVGGIGNDSIYGKEGFDSLEGGAGNDLINGGDNNDWLYGQDGDDELIGGSGDDLIEGGQGADDLFGGTGDDILRFDSSDVNVDGGEGVDTAVFIGYDSLSTNLVNINNVEKIYASYNEDLIDLSSQITDLFIDGNGGLDNITTGSGNDEIIAAGQINAGDGDNIVTASGEANVTTGSGSDNITGGNVIHSGAGDDTITSENATSITALGGNNNITAGWMTEVTTGEGDDVIVAGNLVDAGAGYDVLDLSSFNRNNTVNLNDVNVEKYIGSVAVDTIDASTKMESTDISTGAGKDVIYSMGNDIINGGDDYDSVYFQNAASVTVNNSNTINVENINTTYGDDVINMEQSTSDLYINAEGGNDTITAGLGNDSLSGGEGNDIIFAGLGNDSLSGGSGSDTYFFNLGDGQDTISDFKEAGKINQIVFGEGITKDDLELSFVSMSQNAVVPYALKINIKGTGDSILIPSFMDRMQDELLSPIQTIKFSDNTTMSLTEGLTFTISDSTHGPAQSTKFDDVIIASDNDDNLMGGEGDDSYIYNLGGGSDTITDFGENNKIIFGAGITQDMLVKSRLNDDLVYTIGTEGDKITIKDYYKVLENISTNAAFGSMIFTEDNSEINLVGLNFNDTDEANIIYTSNYHDVIKGNGGDDTIFATSEDDIIDGGEGHDILDITNIDTSAENPFTMSNVSNVEEIRYNGLKNNFINYQGSNDLKVSDNDRYSYEIKHNQTITTGSGNDIVLGGRNDDIINTGDGNDNVRGLGGDDVINTGSGNDYLEGGSGYNELNGGEGDDTYFFFQYDSGYDVITDFDENNTIYFGSGITQDMVTQTQSGNDLLLDISPNGGQITIKNYYTNGAFGSMYFSQEAVSVQLKEEPVLEGIIGTEGDDVLNGTEGDDTIHGLAGNDTIIASAGNDTIDGGEGFDTLDISNLTTSGENPYMMLNTTNVEAIQGSNVKDDTIYHFGSDSLTVSGRGGNDTILTGSGDDIINGGEGDDYLLGSQGNDYIDGGLGNDTYQFNLGDGQDVIVDTDKANTIFFGSNITQDMVTKSQSGNDLILTIGSNGDQITIKDYYIAGEFGSMFFSNDNSSVKLREIPVFNGTDGNDTLNGTDDVDIINGLAGDDIISSGAGNDTIDGGLGSDTYQFNLGDGQDVIIDADKTNTISFGPSITQDMVTKSQSGNDLILTIGSNGDQITIKDYYIAGEFGSMFFSIDNSSVQLKEKPVLSGTDGDDILTSTSEDEIINGLAGNDTIVVDATNDIIDGGEGLDTIDISNLTTTGEDPYQMLNVTNVEVIKGSDTKADYINYDGTDSIEVVGNGGNDDIGTGSGNDVIHGGAGDEWINSKAGDDTVFGDEGNDNIICSSGNDTLYGGIGSDTYHFSLGDGQDIIVDSDVDSNIFFASDITQDMVTKTQSGDDLILTVGSNGDQITIKDYYINKVFGHMTFSNDWSSVELKEISLIEGTEGDDVLSSTAEDDIINGLGGNDTIIAGAGNDIVDGGEGFDTIDISNLDTSGGNSFMMNNVTNVEAIKGSDTKDDSIEYYGDNSLKVDVLGGNDFVSLGSGNDIVNLGAGNDHVNGGAGNDTIDAGDGDDFINSGSGFDTLNGGAGADTYYFELGEGQDIIIDNDNLNTIRFGMGITQDMVTKTQSGDDLILTIGSNGDQITVKDYYINRDFGNMQFDTDGSSVQLKEPSLIVGTELSERLYGTAEDDEIRGLDGNDIIYGFEGNDLIDAGMGNDFIAGYQGNDTILGGSGYDTYYFSLGHGKDVIIDDDKESRIRFASNITQDMVTKSQSGDDLILTIGSYGDQITIKNYYIKRQFGTMQFDSNWTLVELKEITYIDGTDNGEVLNGTEFCDQINGLGGNDTINGGDSDDVIDSGYGYDIVNGGAGDDTLIVDYQDAIDGGEGYDTVQISRGYMNIDMAATNVEKVIGSAGNDTINASNADYSVVIDGKEYNDIITGGSANDYLYGGDGYDTINGGAGNDYIDSGNGYDTVNGGAGDDTLVIDYQDTVDGGEGYDTVQIARGYMTLDVAAANVEKVIGGDGNDTLNGVNSISDLYLDGGAGNDTINSGDGNDVIIGSTGNDTLNGGYGADTYVYGLGDGQDIITDYDSSNTIFFRSDITPDMVVKSQSGNDLILTIGSNGDQITIKDYYINKEFGRMEFSIDGSVVALKEISLVEGTEADNVLTGTDANDVIIGHGGNDTLNGGSGSDEYHFNLGDGQDVITEVDYQNKIVFGSKITQDMVTQSQSGDDLILTIGSNGDQITIKNYYIEEEFGTMEFSSDGSVVELVVMPEGEEFIGTDNDESLYGAEGDDVLYGLAGNDTIYGFEGNDHIHGGTGNDTLYGEVGTDTYHYELGDGIDTISDYKDDLSEKSILEFGNGITASDVSFSQSTNDLMVTLKGDANQSITMKDHFLGDNYNLDEIKFADGSTFDLNGNDINGLIQSMSSFNVETSSTMDSSTPIEDNNNNPITASAI